MTGDEEREELENFNKVAEPGCLLL
ncbi:MAG: hypothetical protein QOG72_1894, partial [Sphingomonadales bacterium]|nr:hypothetical protein [Sphingomonadales bacterium]